MQKQLFEVLQAVSGRPIVIVQADDIGQAYQRAALVVDGLDLPFDAMSENWTIRQARPPYQAAVFAEGYFHFLHEGASDLIH